DRARCAAFEGIDMDEGAFAAAIGADETKALVVIPVLQPSLIAHPLCRTSRSTGIGAQRRGVVKRSTPRLGRWCLVAHPQEAREARQTGGGVAVVTVGHQGAD